MIIFTMRISEAIIFGYLGNRKIVITLENNTLIIWIQFLEMSRADSAEP